MSDWPYARPFFVLIHLSVVLWSNDVKWRERRQITLNFTFSLHVSYMLLPAEFLAAYSYLYSERLKTSLSCFNANLAVRNVMPHLPSPWSLRMLLISHSPCGKLTVSPLTQHTLEPPDKRTNLRKLLLDDRPQIDYTVSTLESPVYVTRLRFL